MECCCVYRGCVGRRCCSPIRLRSSCVSGRPLKLAATFPGNALSQRPLLVQAHRLPLCRINPRWHEEFLTCSPSKVTFFNLPSATHSLGSSLNTPHPCSFAQDLTEGSESQPVSECVAGKPSLAP